MHNFKSFTQKYILFLLLFNLMTTFFNLFLNMETLYILTPQNILSVMLLLALITILVLYIASTIFSTKILYQIGLFSSIISF